MEETTVQAEPAEDLTELQEIQAELTATKARLERSQEHCETLKEHIAKVTAEKHKWRRVALNWTFKMQELHMAFEGLQDGIDNARELELNL